MARMLPVIFLLVLSVSSARGEEFLPDPSVQPLPASPGHPRSMAKPTLSPELDSEQVDFLRRLAHEGDPAMQCLYGLALLNGSAGRFDPADGAEWLRKSAEAGDGRGGFEYGKMLYQGTHGKREQQESLTWLIPAAERGMLEAAYYVGATLLAGEDIEHDAELGEKWLRFAAEGGLGGAQADLGLAYYSSAGGLRQDYAEARRWFTLAAKQGSGDSCNKLGVMYKQGYGVTPDPEHAVLWFGMGANLGDQYAQFNLANCYMNGEWVARDYKHAARWHEQAALRGNVDAQYFIGCLYAEGIGVSKDLGRAREWLALSERSGNEAAGELLERLWEMEDDELISVPEPARVRAGGLLREFVLSPVEEIGRGREVILAIDDDVEISRGETSGSFYLTVPGSPGVLYCESASDDFDVRPGTSIRGIGAGSTGLPGFLHLVEVREEEEVPAEKESEEGGDEE